MMKITLKAARVNAGLTQTDVAEKLGIRPATLCIWENSNKPIRTIYKSVLCQIYKLKITDIRWPEERNQENEN